MFTDWVISIRSDFLTNIFKYFPVFASDYFFIAVIALGYWSRPDTPVFKSLGILVPLSTLLNCTLKNIFQIPRPPITLHLVKVVDPFGFPSGDVQIATVFWLFLAYNVKHKSLKYISAFFIFFIAVSRIYLGVHSVHDVIAGFLFGLITILLWKKYYSHILENKTNKKLWMFVLVIISLFFLISKNLPLSPVVFLGIGALIGFSISNNINMTFHPMSIPQLFTSILLLITSVKLIPVFTEINSNLLYLNLVIKYTIIVFGIFTLIPYIQSKIYQCRKKG